MSEPMMRKYHILLVDDNDDDREYFKKTLENIDTSDYSYCIHVAENIEEACKISRVTDIDAYMIDYYMPDGDGADLLKTLQAQTEDVAVPALILTGEPSIEAQAITAQHGALDYLVKSMTCNKEKLDIALKKVIDWADEMNKNSKEC